MASRTTARGAVIAPTGSSGTSPGGGAGSTDPSSDASVGGYALALAALLVLGLGAVAVAIFRRSRRGAAAAVTDDRAPLSNPTPWATTMNDPLLEAMAASAQHRGPRGAIPPPLGGPTPITSWVKRLDAEINVLADHAAAPYPPPARDAPPARGGRPEAGPSGEAKIGA